MVAALALGTSQANWPADAAYSPQRLALLEAAETALARGMASSAIIGFERAGMMLHAADAELGLVRAWMQQGEYRRALAFAAHTAGAHRNLPAASAFYAWLLRLAGQDRFAAGLLERTQAMAPDDAFVREAAEALAAGTPLATGILLEPPHRLAPQAVMRGDQPSPPAAAAVVASGVLLPSGRQALVPAATLAGARQIWVRNGLGVATQAVIDTAGTDALRDQRLALLQLNESLGDAGASLAARDPHAGSPAWVAAFGVSAQAQAAWPWMTQGFVGTVPRPGGMRKLGFALAHGRNSGPVFDMAGCLVGFALGGNGTADSLVPVSVLRAMLDDAGGDPAAGATSQPATPCGTPPVRLAPDQLYELALRQSVQLITLR